MHTTTFGTLLTIVFTIATLVAFLTWNYDAIIISGLSGLVSAAATIMDAVK